jgi:hypothetical protein
LSDQSESEQKRQERAKLVSAFNRRAWQPSVQSQFSRRVLAGGAALIVVAGAVFGLGALSSYNHKKAAEERTRQAALATRNSPASQYQPQGSQSTPTTAAPNSPKPSRPANSAASPPSRDTAAGPVLPKSAKSAAASGVLIKNVMTGMCVDIPAFGKGTLNGRVQQHTCDGSAHDNQRWDLVVGQKGGGPNGANLFTIRNTKDGYCLDLPGYGSVDQGGVTEWHCDPGPRDNQMWYLEKKATGRYWIRNFSSKNRQCLDVSGLNGSGGQDARLTIYPCSLQDDHQWSFLP